MKEKKKKKKADWLEMRAELKKKEKKRNRQPVISISTHLSLIRSLRVMG